jgi:DNA sulfur modification protein DndD
MRFETITIYNFKNYKGKNIFSFKKKKGKNKNITVIGGLNGAGKTTLLEAIKICLYGKNFNGNFLTKSDYQKYIKSTLNKKSVKEKNTKSFVELTVIFDDSYPTFTLDIRRIWEFKDVKEFDERFEVYRDNSPLEFISKDYWQEYINHLIPPNVSEFFFFNGEKVKELAVGSNADEILKSSIKDLIGLNLYENLQSDLLKLKSKIRRRNEKKEPILKNIKKFEQELELKGKEKQRIETKIKEYKIKIQTNTKTIEEIDKELKRKAGSFAQQKKESEKQIIKLKEKNASLNEQIINISKDHLPFFLSKNLIKELLSQLEYEQEHKNIKYIQKTLKNHLDEFTRKLNQNSKTIYSLSKNEKIQLNNEIKKTFLDVVNDRRKSAIEILHDLSISDIENIKHFFQPSTNNISNNYEKMLKEREKNILKIQSINRELRQIPGDTYVISNLEKINKIKQQNETMEKNITDFKEKIIKLEEETNSLHSEIEKIEEEIFCVKEDKKKIQYITKINTVLNEYMAEIINLNTKNLEDTISTMYHSLSNKGDMVKEIKVDPESFTTHLFDFDGHPVSKDGISEGEKEIYAISVLWGLSTVSHHKLPMIIDTPLSKLDNTHVNNITSKFFPKASDQVILLSQDREIDQNIYSILKPYINQSYTLLQTDENKIKKGYFFE